jgi:hypothetical protein
MNFAVDSVNILERTLFGIEFDDDGDGDISSYNDELISASGLNIFPPPVVSDDEVSDDGKDDSNERFQEDPLNLPQEDEESDGDIGNSNNNSLTDAQSAECERFHNKTQNCCRNKCIEAFTEAERAVVNQHIIGMMTKNANERREALQYYLLGCITPADDSDPAAKKRKYHRDWYAADKAAATPESAAIDGRQSFSYAFLGKYICATVAPALFLMGEKALRSAQISIKNGTTVPPRSQKGKKNAGKSRDNTRAVVNFIQEFADRNGLPDPSSRGPQRIIYLPAGNTITSVHVRYVETFETDAVGYEHFTKVWKEKCSHIKVRPQRTDYMCDFCCLMKSKGKSHSLERMAHLAAAKEARENFEANILQTREKNNTRATQLSFDFAEKIVLPRFIDQPKQMYYLAGLKLDTFGIANNTNGTQLNFPLVEGQWPNQKSVNTIGSMLYYYLLTMLRDRNKVIHLMCDNCPDQNKNRYMMWFLSYLTLTTDIEEISLRFLVAGHTKNFCDACFGLLNRSIKDKQVLTPTDCIENFKHSSSCNTVADARAVTWYDWKSFLEQYYDKKIIDISAMHLFRFRKDAPGVVEYKMKDEDTEWQQLCLFKSGVDAALIPSTPASRQVNPDDYKLENQIAGPNLSRRQYLDRILELFVGDEFAYAKDSFFE